MVRIDLNSANFSKDFLALRERVKKPRALMVGVGREAQQQLKKHFRAKDRSEPNRLGGRRTHYWARVANSVQAPVTEKDGTRVVVGITDPTIQQKIFGGRIVAKNAKMLTIPQSDEAYGRTARTFEAETGLKLILIKSKPMGNRGLAFLVSKRDPNSKFFQIEYVLKRSVMQQKDPTALPEMGDGSPFLQTLLSRGMRIFERENEAAGGGGKAINQ